MRKNASEAVAECLSYAASFGGFYLFVFLAKRYAAAGGSCTGALGKIVRICVTGEGSGSRSGGYQLVESDRAQEESGEDAESLPPLKPPPQPSVLRQASTLAICAAGIQVAYLCWGVMQETIMTSTYSSGEHFRSSKFLVFANRIIALFVAMPALWWEERAAAAAGGGAARRRRGAGYPLYRYSYCSVSNIVSSACQYEALQFVSFPTQVLAKACKMVPVMLMGYAVSGKSYEPFEYLLAAGITAGVVTFKLCEENDAPVKDTQTVGILLIVVYMAADSFTSNWQSRVFKEALPSSMKMMAVVRASSRAHLRLATAAACAVVPRARAQARARSHPPSGRPRR